MIVILESDRQVTLTFATDHEQAQFVAITKELEAECSPATKIPLIRALRNIGNYYIIDVKTRMLDGSKAAPNEYYKLGLRLAKQLITGEIIL